ncbi:phosphatidylserine/phosphatidylglycerophosphate/cardiolipin synthase-like enzyme [Paraburkholderia bryophila]|uniref:Phosphatidylserine/phosphatidylglycerophosphate/ cardiolipin synthase-like enzyme n=1 Tax=Paraburkholderia bryophila TaxID=420952 RepID=A0A7Z0B0Y0_9BURK|nr:phosphatidylserine/phosphatidylglycerophosphate/cardiolipin synthase-like enzyme [Paraburkholderia bryophila]
MLIANLSSGEKKIEHKIERRYASDDPQFLRSMGLLLGPPVIAGNRFEMLLNGDRIFPSMLEGIRSARHTITFETFIYWSGEIGEQIAQALADKAREGVAVHVLLDWVGSSKMDKRYLNLLRDGGAEVIQYHKPHWTGLGRMNDRTHRKLLVIDGRIGFTGGVGIAPEWTGHAQDEKHWRDTHFRVAGPVVGHMQAVFMDNWVKASGNVLHGADYFPKVEAAGEGPRAYVQQLAFGRQRRHAVDVPDGDHGGHSQHSSGERLLRARQADDQRDRRGREARCESANHHTG